MMKEVSAILVAAILALDRAVAMNLARDQSVGSSSAQRSIKLVASNLAP